MANQIMQFPTYHNSKHLEVGFHYHRVLTRQKERKGGDVGDKEKPEKGTLIYLAFAHK